MNKVGIIGAGSMGTDVALVLACYGYEVVLKDIDAKILDQARHKIEINFRMAQMIRPAWKNLDLKSLLDKIKFVTVYDPFHGVDMVIENVPEDWKLKSEVYKELASVCRTDILYGVNTSCISITKVASLLPQPDKVIGMHFMNPATLKDMVELVRGFHTSEATVQEAKAFLKSLGKSSVIASDVPGFIANRLSHLLMNEAAFLVQDNVAMPKDIDLLFKKGYGHAMGPLETADLIGLDTVIDSLGILYDNFQDSKFRCCPLLRKMVDAGLTGRKTGQGFYKYGDTF